METKYRFQKTAPAAFSSLWESLNTTQEHPSEFARFQIFIYENPVTYSMEHYPALHDLRSLPPQLGNEMFILKIDLRNAWSGKHFKPNPDAVCWWLEENGQKVGEQEYVSYLITGLGIYYLHFDMKHGEVTIRVFIRSMNEHVDSEVSKGSEGIFLSFKEAALVRNAVSAQLYIEQKRSAVEYSATRIAALNALYERLHKELQEHHEAEIAYIRSIGSSILEDIEQEASHAHSGVEEQ